MNKKTIDFLRSLKEKDYVVLILSSCFITGAVVRYDEGPNFIEISETSISNVYNGTTITIPAEQIIAWGKK